MRGRYVALALAAAMMVGGCVQVAPRGPEPGAVVPTVTTAPGQPLYAPIDRTALAFGLPDLVQGTRLVPSSVEMIAIEEDGFANDLLVRPILIEQGLSATAVLIEQKSDRDVGMPALATSAIWVDGVPAERFARFDPSFYLLLTSVTPSGYRWTGEKPSREDATILDRPVWSSDWGSFFVVWYTWGEVLYIVLAANQQLLEATLRQMPRPSDTT